MERAFSARERHERRAAVLLALVDLAEADPEGAAAVAAGFLEVRGAGSPTYDHFLSDIRADAAWWASTATAPELEAYAGAALREIGRKALALPARMRAFADLWLSLPPGAQRDFLARVCGEGRRSDG